MSRQIVNIVVAGLGGQGVIKASDILADAAFRAGYDVKKAEVHGMSQRGGSVTSDVRFGARVWSPMVTDGEADFVVVLEETQVGAVRHKLKPDGQLLSAAQIDARALPTAKALNVAMLGLLSPRLDIPLETWLEAVRASLPERLHAANEQAFALGRAIAEKEERHHA